MKYKVIGWTYAGNEMFPRHEKITPCVSAAVVEDIRKHGYLFGGNQHEDYCPVLNDGTYVLYTCRDWGAIMAQAHGEVGDNAHALACITQLINEKAITYPEWNKQDVRRIVPKEMLAETFAMRLADDMFDAVKAGTKKVEIRLWDDKRQKVDIGDYIEFVRIGDRNQRVKRKVVDIVRADNFAELFVKDMPTENKNAGKELRFSPTEVGSPEGSDMAAFVDGMYAYYTKEQEEKPGVVAFVLEEPQPFCKTAFAVWRDDDETAKVLAKRWPEGAREAEDLLAWVQTQDADLRKALKSELGEAESGFECFADRYQWGINDCYDVDINVMLRKTLQGMWGKEAALKAIATRFGVRMTLDAYCVIVKDNEQPNPLLSLDKDIIAFLHKSGVDFRLQYRTV